MGTARVAIRLPDEDFVRYVPSSTIKVIVLQDGGERRLVCLTPEGVACEGGLVVGAYHVDVLRYGGGHGQC